MPDDRTVSFEPFKLTDSEGWRVLVTFPDGHTRSLRGFPTEAAARDWIEKHSAKWLTSMRQDRY